MESEKFIKKNYLSFCLILIVFSSAQFAYSGYINHTFWYDEAYTIAMMKHSFRDMLIITSEDVHPPLYYFMLKAFCSIAGYSLFAMRIFSNIGIIACLLFGLFPIKRLFGRGISFTFILLIALLPVCQYMGVEIRMYSWTMFFVLACSIYAYEAYSFDKRYSYIKMIFFAICGAYTHYFGLLAVVCILLLLSAVLIMQKKNIKSILISFATFVLAYSIWIPVLWRQTVKVKAYFWIENITPKDLLLFCYYFFSPKEPSHPYMIFSKLTMSIALLLMLILVALMIFRILKIWNCDRKLLLKTGTLFVSVYFICMFISLTISYTIKPIIVFRYTCCLLGPIAIGISTYGYCIYKNGARIFPIFCLTMLFTLSCARFFSEKAYYKMKNHEKGIIQVFLKSDKSIPQIITAFTDSYPNLAEISILNSEATYYLFDAENSNTKDEPFSIQSIESFQNFSEFFRIFPYTGY